MKIYCDGSTKEACYIVEGQKPVIVPYPKKVTNNVGEYQAVILALEEAIRLGLEQAEVLTDSLLVVNQVNGDWKCRMKHLLPFRDKVRELLGLTVLVELGEDDEVIGFDELKQLRWIPREENLAGRILG